MKKRCFQLTATNQPALSQQQREALLNFWSYPDDAAGRAEIDRASQTPNHRGSVLCWRRRKQCNNPDCADPDTGRPYQFKAGFSEQWNCPLCGKDRHCRKHVQLSSPASLRHLNHRNVNTGCRKHGGATPSGWDAVQTGAGLHSRVLEVTSQGADPERFKRTAELNRLAEDIAFLRSHIHQIMSRYEGGASRQLLQQMKRNRTQTRAELRQGETDPKRLRQLQRELDQLIEQGLKSYRLIEEWWRSVNQLSKFIKAYDAHVMQTGFFVNEDQMKMVGQYMTDTIHFSLALLLQASHHDVAQLLEAMGITFQEPSTVEEQQVMLEGLRQFQQEQHDRLKRFMAVKMKETAQSGQF